MFEMKVGSESHSSNWGKFNVKGLDSFLAHEGGARTRHEAYSEMAGEVPGGTLFTVWQSSGNKRGTEDADFYVCVALDPATPEAQYERIIGPYGTYVHGPFMILAHGDGNVRSARLLSWWQATPAAQRTVTYAVVCGMAINKRGQATRPDFALAATTADPRDATPPPTQAPDALEGDATDAEAAEAAEDDAEVANAAVLAEMAAALAPDVQAAAKAAEEEDTVLAAQEADAAADEAAAQLATVDTEGTLRSHAPRPHIPVYYDHLPLHPSAEGREALEAMHSHDGNQDAAQAAAKHAPAHVWVTDADSYTLESLDRATVVPTGILIQGFLAGGINVFEVYLEAHVSIITPDAGAAAARRYVKQIEEMAPFSVQSGPLIEMAQAVVAREQAKAAAAQARAAQEAGKE